eukprot:scaffold1595_cov372-Prasinococcus_capsulatus_cf.AAC.1
MSRAVSSRPYQHLRKLRPIRPKPLIATCFTQRPRSEGRRKPGAAFGRSRRRPEATPRARPSVHLCVKGLVGAYAKRSALDASGSSKLVCSHDSSHLYYVRVECGPVVMRVREAVRPAQLAPHTRRPCGTGFVVEGRAPRKRAEQSSEMRNRAICAARRPSNGARAHARPPIPPPGSLTPSSAGAGPLVACAPRRATHATPARPLQTMMRRGVALRCAALRSTFGRAQPRGGANGSPSSRDPIRPRRFRQNAPPRARMSLRQSTGGSGPTPQSI